jgi:ribosomal protein S12 methylthiotransferase accessory factor
MTSSKASLLILGSSSMLYTIIQQELAPHYNLIYAQDDNIIPDVPQDTVVISVSDCWNPQRDSALNTFSWSRRIAWLRTYVEFGTAIIGPFVRPGHAGCVACAEARMLAAREDAREFTNLRKSLGQRAAPNVASWYTGASLMLLAQLIAAELMAVSVPSGVPRTSQALLRVRLDTLAYQTHRFLPDPTCVVCGDLPDDTASDAQIVLQTRQKVEPFTYRVRSLAPVSEQLAQLYVDPVSGVIRALAKDTSNLYANVVACAAGKKLTMVSVIR